MVDIESVRAQYGITDSAMGDHELQRVLDAETHNQAKVCDIPEWGSADLDLALMRRVARSVSAQGIPLGVVGLDTEYGTARMPSYDPEIERLEGPYRRAVFA
jgi:hypothetical protein